MLRLKLPRTTPGIQVWDTPTPLDLYHCTLHRADIGDSMQFRTIELRKATGITFFFPLDKFMIFIFILLRPHPLARHSNAFRGGVNRL